MVFINMGIRGDSDDNVGLLNVAIEEDNTELIKELMDDIDDDEVIETRLRRAIQNGNIEATKIILDRSISRASCDETDASINLMNSSGNPTKGIDL